jgi:glycosyltransferase involved in cell wall biosynthesis
MAGTPIISVIIPTHKRRAQLRQALLSLAEQDCGRDCWEVIVVEDGEEEPPNVELAALMERMPLRIFRQPYSGCGIARNTGAAHARGRYLVFTDDDCLFPRDWLSRFREVFERTADCVVAGRSTNWLRDNPYSETTQALIDYLLSRANTSPEHATLAIGNNFGVPAEGFRSLGGFSSSYFQLTAEDRDFCGRWLADGRRIVYAPDIVVHHAHALTLHTFLRQHFQYGRGAYVYYRLQARRRGSRVRLESPGFYLSLLLWPWSARCGARALPLGLLLPLAQTAHTAGYLSKWLGRSGVEQPK